MNEKREVNDLKLKDDTALKKASYKFLKTKKRNWCFVLYEDSAPGDWVSILQKTGLECAISPKHDKDINPTGEPKKPHYHIILLFPGPTTGSVVWDLVVGTLHQPMPIPLESVRGMYRYLIHRDNPEKFQYKEEDIKTLNGFDISNFSDLSLADKTKIKLELTKLINEKEFIEYSEFINYVISLDKNDYFIIASSNTLYFNSFLRSKRHSLLNDKKIVIVNRETGEILNHNEENEED